MPKVEVFSESFVKLTLTPQEAFAVNCALGQCCGEGPLEIDVFNTYMELTNIIQDLYGEYSYREYVVGTIVFKGGVPTLK